MSAPLAAWWPWLDAIGWTLLHFLWQGLVIGAGFAIARALLPKERCNARYVAGLVALTLLALCPVLTFMVMHDHQQVAAATTQTLGLMVAGGATMAGIGSDVTGIAGVDRALPWLALLWGAGVVLVAARTWYQWRTLSSVVRRFAVPDAALDLALQRVMRQVNYVRRIRVLVSERIDTPTLIGWLKPVILLPAAVALGFARDQIELILAHEISHLRRYDHLVNLVQTVIETLLFYHPVVHWISRDVRNERELCCDHLALRLTAGEPHRYARTLTALEELRQPSTRLALAATGGVLLDRVRRIVGVPAAPLATPRPASVPWSLAAIGLGVALAVVLRVGQVDVDAATAHVTALAIDWLPAAERRVLPSIALAVPFERPHLTLAPMPRAHAQPTTAKPGDATTPSRADAVTATIARLPAPALADDFRLDLAAATARPELTDMAPGRPAPIRVPAALVTHAAPKAEHIVAPEYPAQLRDDRTETVQARFSIAADGSVRDIEVDRAAGAAAFASAVERALAQWRFRPAASPANRSARYLQTFVFRASGGKQDEADCVNSTGSHICRHADAPPVVGYTLSGNATRSSEEVRVH